MTTSPAEPKKLLIRVIWGALTVSLLLYVFLVTQVLNLRPEHGGRDPGELVLMIQLASAGMALGSIIIFASVLTPGKIQERFLKIGPSVLDRVLPFFIICWAMNESICVLGFVLSVLSNDGSRIVPYFAGALLLNLAMFPRISKIQ